jgi:oxygen-dependent protoporphyrinogen oxidase
MKARAAIVGGGITGLATGAWLEHDHGIDDYVVLEASSRAGGKIRSELDAGFTLEWGPQGFLDNAPDTLELASILGLDDVLVRADEKAADRFILREGRLRRVATSPPAFMFSDILPLAGRLRLLGEPFASPHPGHDETVFEFANRRIGRQAAEVLVDAMVTGVFAGDSRELSLAATFPKMAAMESEHGSLTRALFVKMREARRTGSRSAGPAGPGGTLTTFSGGMVRLTDRLAESVGDRLLLKRPLQTLERQGPTHILNTEEGAIEAETVLLALPAERAARLMTDLAPDAIAPLAATPTAPIAVVMLGYGDRNAFGRPVSGFGFLVPRGEDDALLGTLYCHDIFPGQAPDGTLLLRAMVGGARSPDAVGLNDDRLLDRVRDSLARVFGADPGPERVWIVRWEQGISQYTVGHLERVAAAEAAAGEADIELAGSPYRGGMLDAGCWMLDAGCWMLDAGCWMHQNHEFCC